MTLSLNFSAEIGMCLTFFSFFSPILNIPNTLPELKSKVNIMLMGLMYGQSLLFSAGRALFLLNKDSQ